MKTIDEALAELEKVKAERDELAAMLVEALKGTIGEDKIAEFINIWNSRKEAE